MARDEGTKKVADLLKGERMAMLATRAPDGTLMSRPMTLQQVEFDGDLWFFVERDSPPMQHVRVDPQVNVSVSSATTWVSLTGEARQVDDEAKKRELWNPVVEAWFPDGPDATEVTLLRVDASSAEYWESPGRLATLISFVKAKVTGDRVEAGDSETVEL